MEVVVARRRALLTLAALMLVGVTGWAGVAALANEPAVGDAPATETSALAADAAMRCAKLAPDGQRWRQANIEPNGRAALRRSLGNAALTLVTAQRQRPHEWSSDMGIDAVVAIGEDGVFARRFDRERYDGRFDPDQLGELREVTFCYDYELTISKDIIPTATRTYAWQLSESVEPIHLQLTDDKTAHATYRIEVDRDAGTLSHWQVRGTISIDNLTPFDATIDRVAETTDDGVEAQVDCGVDIPGYILESGETLTCRYRTRLLDDAARVTRTAVLTSGPVAGVESEAAFDFRDAAEEVVDERIVVTDTTGRTWTFEADASAEYRREFTCADAGVHPTAVRIEGSDQIATAAITVDCGPPSDIRAPRGAKRNHR